MRIAQIAPLFERIPPRKYGGTERVVYALTEELVRRGHEVTLFATKNSPTSAKLVSVVDQALRGSARKGLYCLNEWLLFNIGVAYSQQNEFDIIHDHNGFISLPTANVARVPIILTWHSTFTPSHKKILGELRKPYLVAISKAQIKNTHGLNIIGTVHHGLNMEHYPFVNNLGKYLLFVGRIAMDKGVHFAIKVAQKLDKPLIIAAKLDREDDEYFCRYIKPLLSDKRIKWVGEVAENKRNKLMSKALCLLHPVVFKEPFGLTIIEAMACGCPVVAFNKGSIPELVKNGKTGYIVNNVNEMAKAVSKTDLINRIDCRRFALTNFTVEKMVDEYEKIYSKVFSLHNASFYRKSVMVDFINHGSLKKRFG